MASTGPQYPDYLNPFGSDEEEEDNTQQANKTKSQDDYPDYLSPFSCEEDDIYEDKKLNGVTTIAIDDYDDSLNPFGDDEIQQDDLSSSKQDENKDEKTENSESKNPFDDDLPKSDEGDTLKSETHSETPTPKSYTPQPESLEPPKPLPRTKSLLKKENALKRRQQEQQLASEQSNHQINSLQSATSSTTSSSSLTIYAGNNTTTTIGSFQRRKHKRNAPPVPVNFKRQVSGSLDAIDTELNEIGNKLEIIERESEICQETLKSKDQVEEADFTTTRNKFIELIKRKNSIVRRQKELMYKKRELKLDQIYSDIEYELRMIGNKQLSNKTPEDEIKEKELLNKLVEIVEEKNDIVENLNKESTSDDHEIEETFRRLNILDCMPDDTLEKNKSQPVSISPPPQPKPISVPNKSDNCDKKSLAKLSKIATLLPKSGTIKGKIKIKRKHLFKRNCDSTKSTPIEPQQ